MFQHVWLEFDGEGTGIVDRTCLNELLRKLPHPMGYKNRVRARARVCVYVCVCMCVCVCAKGEGGVLSPAHAVESAVE